MADKDKARETRAKRPFTVITPAQILAIPPAKRKDKDR